MIKAVYALGDPETGTIHYIGSAEHPEKRFIKHLAPSKFLDPRSCQRVTEWINELRQRGLKPVLAVLFWTDKPQDEYLTIDRMRGAGYPLLNSFRRFYPKTNDQQASAVVQLALTQKENQ